MEFQRKNNNSFIGRLRGPLVKITIIVLVLFCSIYALGSVEFPSPNKKIEKIIPNENFKIVK
tara:strand:- start:592 stop:777 length:186 start_codon:yes stop_codon:yes gene_type:complete